MCPWEGVGGSYADYFWNDTCCRVSLQLQYILGDRGRNAEEGMYHFWGVVYLLTFVSGFVQVDDLNPIISFGHFPYLYLLMISVKSVQAVE